MKMTVFFFLSTLHACVSLFFFPLEKSNAFVYTKYSFTACDRHRQPFECSREEKKNLIVVFFYSFTASMDLFTRRGHRTFILLNEKKNVSWTNTEIDGNEMKQFWLFSLNWMKNDCISDGDHRFDYGCQLSARPILTSLNGLAHANIPMLIQ